MHHLWLKKGDTMVDWIITNCESVGNTHDICQDHTEYMVSNQVSVGALADGVSSNRYSDKGAVIVTRIACQEMCEKFNEYYSRKLSSVDFVHKIQNEVKFKCSDSYDINQMKSTLLVCAIRENKYILGHIGDGAILCFGKESYVISPPQENEVGGTATYTILDFNADKHFCFKFGYIDDFDGFLLTSDGLLGNVYYSGTDIPQLAYELFGSVYKESSPLSKNNRDSQFKSYLANHIQKGNDLADDCSIFMIARRKKTGYVDYEVSNGFEADVKWPCKCGKYNRMDEVRCSNCRIAYLSLYAPSFVCINSKETFFSKLNKWISLDSNIPFDPGTSAEVIDDKVFEAICESIKKTVVTRRISSENKIVQHSDNANNAVEAQKFSVNRLINLGTTALFKLNEWRAATKINSGYSRQQVTKSEKDNVTINKPLKVSVSRNQLIEGAYRLGHLTSEFVNNGINCEIKPEQLDIIEAMLSPITVFDILLYTNEKPDTLHYYRAKDKLVAVCDNGTSNFTCILWFYFSMLSYSEVLPDSLLIPRDCFQEQIVSNQKLDNVACEQKIKYISWDWYESYTKEKSNASKMLKVFCETLNKNNMKLGTVVNCFWVIARNQHDKELVAYLLTQSHLILLKSVDLKKVSIKYASVSDGSALYLRGKYLKLTN